MSDRPHAPVVDSAPHRVSFTSRDEAEIIEFVRQIYVAGRMRSASVRPGSGFEAVAVDHRGLGADRVSSGVYCSVATEPLDHVHLIAVDSGRLRIGRPGAQVSLGPGGVMLCPTGVPIDIQTEPLRTRGLRLTAAQFGAVAEELTGVVGGGVRFAGTTPVSAAARTYWQAVMRLVGGALLATDSPAEHELVAAEMLRLAVVSALHTFANSTMERPHTGPGQVAPAAVRRAVAMMEEHAGLPLSLADVAAAAGTSSRALQYAFQRHHGTTPMGYLRRVRLEQAHRDLQAAEPARGDTVRQVARRWGFGHPGRFAAVYQATYGCPPRQTLYG